MKFKQQEEETPKNNSFLEDVNDLLSLTKAYVYAIACYSNYKKESQNKIIDNYINNLQDWCKALIRLSTALNPEHIEPEFTVTYIPVREVKDLMKFEEKFYNMLKAIGDRAIEEKNSEVLSYVGWMIRNFKHYFCTLVHEDDNSGETSS